jgi:hypothetical protein
VSVYTERAALELLREIEWERRPLLRHLLPELRRRLALAEAVCLMYGWSPCHDETERDKATHELWSRWANAVPKTFLDGRNHPELDDDAVAGLASRRDASRSADQDG